MVLSGVGVFKSTDFFSLPHLCAMFCCCCVSRSVVPDSLRPCALQPTRLLCPWDFLGKTTGAGCHFLLQGTFLTQGLNPSLTSLALAGRFLFVFFVFFFTTSAILEAPFNIDRDINIYTHRKICAWMYTEALFIMAKNWNQYIHQKKNKWIVA